MSDAASQLLSLIQGAELWRAKRKLQHLYAKPFVAGVNPGPYQWQVDWHNAGATHPERALIAANRVGKTRTAAVEVASHATGLYPAWWQGRRFNKGINILVAGPTNELTRDIIQNELVGPVLGEEESGRTLSGTGWIPADCLGEHSFRSSSVRNVLDTVKVKHISGEMSMIYFKSYEQGDVKFQGVPREVVWLDEEPDEKIFTEALTRTLDVRGILMFTRTPLFGMTPVIRHFVSGGKPGVMYKNVTWADAPHLTPEDCARILQSFPEHERETRSKGTPLLGSGGVYNVPQEMYTCEPFPIPKHFRRLAACDFGIDHPAAGSWMAYDPDCDTIYIYDCYRQSNQTAAYHAAAFTQRGKWIPVAWPHDGMNREKSGGETLKDQYAKHGANMLPISARYDDDTGGGQRREPITVEILERMRSGRFKVFAHLKELLEELRLLHRENGQINPVQDDIESSVRYNVMMLRYAVCEADVTSPRQWESEESRDSTFDRVLRAT